MSAEKTMTDESTMTVGTTEVADAAAVESLLLARTYLYTLFHKLLGGNPNGSLMEALLSGATFEALDCYTDDSAPLRGAKEFLQSLKAAKANDPAGFADEVTGEFTRLFVGPGSPQAIPYESPYRTNEATYFQRNTVEVRREFRARGFQAKRFEHVPDDHIALLCDFLARMSQRSLDALRSGDLASMRASLRDQQAFANAHLADWVSDLARRARFGETATFYPQMLEALACFVESDLVFLGEAAYWAECLMAESETDGSELAGSLEQQEGETFLAVMRALDTLRAIRLFGLEDCELATLA